MLFLHTKYVTNHYLLFILLQSFQSEPVPGLHCKSGCQCQVFPPTAGIFCCECAAKVGGQFCFPSLANAIHKNGDIVAMSELRVGDKVQTGTFFIVSTDKPKRQNKLPSQILARAKMIDGFYFSC